MAAGGGALLVGRQVSGRPEGVCLKKILQRSASFKKAPAQRCTEAPTKRARPHLLWPRHSRLSCSGAGYDPSALDHVECSVALNFFSRVRGLTAAAKMHCSDGHPPPSHSARRGPLPPAAAADAVAAAAVAVRYALPSGVTRRPPHKAAGTAASHAGGCRHALAPLSARAAGASAEPSCSAVAVRI